MNPSPLLNTTPAHPPLRFLLRDALPADREPLRAWLRRDPVAHLHLLAWLDICLQPQRDSTRARLILADAGTLAEPLLGACLLLGERMAVPATPFPQVARAFGERLRRERAELEHITGEDAAADALWEGYAPGATPRLNQRQRAYLLHPTPAPAPTTPLRPAALTDLEPLFVASAHLYREETLSDPANTAPLPFRRMIRDRILQQQSWVWTDEDGVRFKAELALQTSEGALLSGVYTRPDARRRGAATAALRHLIQSLQPTTPRLILHVNADNAPARTLYEALGFRYTCPWRTLFVI